MLAGYVPVLFLFILATTVGSVMLMVGGMVRPNNNYEEKDSPYECGIIPSGDALGRVKPSYYIYAMLFLAFDVEAIFLFPWAVVFERIGVFALVEMVLFILILVIGLLYVWYKGALNWLG